MKRRVKLVAPVVMVDELIVWTDRPPFHRGSCHLTCSDMGTLHRFAAKLGLKRSWFQEHRNPELNHYDLTPGKRTLALALGAKFVPGMEQARARLRKRNQWVSCQRKRESKRRSKN